MKTTASRKTRTFENDDIKDQFDELVVLASRGDRRAIGAIGIAFGPTLLEEARTVLGEFDQEADDVLEDFLLALVDRRLLFTPAHGRATPWICGIVRAIALQRRRELQRDWGIDTEHE
jgi:DNA-directed RNA polymerase specialized sigma24 family protein